MNFDDLDDYEIELVGDSKIEYLLRQLQSSGLSNEEKKLLEHELETFNINTERFKALSIYISNSQMDLINSGFNYNETDIKIKLRKEI